LLPLFPIWSSRAGPAPFFPLLTILGRPSKLVSRAQLPSPLSGLANEWGPLRTHCHSRPARQHLPPPFRVRLGLHPSQIARAVSDFPGFGCACHALALYKSAPSLPPFFSPESQVEALARVLATAKPNTAAAKFDHRLPFRSTP
jgi:hypothetical protein